MGSGQPSGRQAYHNTIALVSKGTAIEETIGTPEDNEVSLYTWDAGRIAMTHYCALTANGNQPRLETPVTSAQQNEFVFAFVSATNLARPGGCAYAANGAAAEGRQSFQRSVDETGEGQGHRLHAQFRAQVSGALCSLWLSFLWF